MSNSFKPASAAGCVKHQGKSTSPASAGSTAPKLPGAKGMSAANSSAGAKSLKGQYGMSGPKGAA